MPRLMSNEPRINAAIRYILSVLFIVKIENGSIDRFILRMPSRFLRIAIAWLPPPNAAAIPRIISKYPINFIFSLTLKHRGAAVDASPGVTCWTASALLSQMPSAPL